MRPGDRIIYRFHAYFTEIINMETTSYMFISIYHIVALIPNIQHELSCDIDDLHVINQLYHGSALVRAVMHSLTLVHYRIVHAHEPGYN